MRCPRTGRCASLSRADHVGNVNRLTRSRMVLITDVRSSAGALASCGVAEASSERASAPADDTASVGSKGSTRCSAVATHRAAANRVASLAVAAVSALRWAVCVKWSGQKRASTRVSEKRVCECVSVCEYVVVHTSTRVTQNSFSRAQLLRAVRACGHCANFEYSDCGCDERE